MENKTFFSKKNIIIASSVAVVLAGALFAMAAVKVDLSRFLQGKINENSCSTEYCSDILSYTVDSMKVGESADIVVNVENSGETVWKKWDKSSRKGEFLGIFVEDINKNHQGMDIFEHSTNTPCFSTRDGGCIFPIIELGEDEYINPEVGHQFKLNVIPKKEGTYKIKFSMYKDKDITQDFLGSSFGDTAEQMITIAPASITYSCTGPTPDHASLCDKDDQELTANTSKTLISACTTTRKCEYVCEDDYSYNVDENVCELNTNVNGNNVEITNMTITEGSVSKTTLFTGKEYTLKVTVTNKGSNTWKAADGYKLGAANHIFKATGLYDTNNFNYIDAIGFNRIELPLTTEVKTNGSHTFTKTFTVNRSLFNSAQFNFKDYKFQWKMLKEKSGEETIWFGQPIERTVHITNNDAKYDTSFKINDVAKTPKINPLANYTFTPSETYNLTIGQESTIRIKMKNTGSSTWTEANRYRLGLLSHQTATNKITPPDTYNAVDVFGIGDPEEENVNGDQGRAEKIPTTVTVAPNGTYEFIIKVTPRLIDDKKEYIMKWQMVEDDTPVEGGGGAGDGEWFGDVVAFKVKLVDGGGTSVTGVSVTPSTLNLVVGGSIGQLSATVQPTTATNKNVTWSSSDTTKARVDSSGKVTPVAVGTATITATSVSNPTKKGTATVTITASPIPVTSVTVTPNTLNLVVGGSTGQLSATAQPTTATNKNVTWNSSDTTKARVSSTGEVTPVAVGTATITATSVSNPTKTGTATVTVGTVIRSPEFNPPAGTYTSAQSITITSATTGATIRYTQNNPNDTTPSVPNCTTIGTQYNGPINVTSTTSIRAIACKLNTSTNKIDPSVVTMATYIISSSSTPSITVTSPNGGESWQLGQSRNITWNATNITGKVRLVLFKIENNTDVRLGNIVVDLNPTPGSYAWTVGAYKGDDGLPRTATTGTNYRIRAVSINNTSINDFSDNPFAITAVPSNQVLDPQFDPPSTTSYTSAQNVTISTLTPEARIWYTTNLSETIDCNLGTRYLNPISVTQTTTIKAIACKEGMTKSGIVTATYTITINPPPPTTCTLRGDVNCDQTVNIIDLAIVLAYYNSSPHQVPAGLQNINILNGDVAKCGDGDTGFIIDRDISFYRSYLISTATTPSWPQC